MTQPGIVPGQVPSGIDQKPQGDLNSNIQVSVYPEWYKQVTLEWTVPENWLGAKFHVYFWPGGNEAYVRLTSSPTTNQFFFDTTTREYSKIGQGSYVIEAILPFTNQIVRSYPASWEYKRRDKVEKIANEIQRREYMLLSKFAGTKCFFFRRRTYGVRCPRCWSVEQEKIMDDHCEVCYGTSFEGGYFDPIAVFVQFDPDNSTKRNVYSGTIEPNAISGWTISMPAMTSKDIIIRAKDWNVYKMLDVNITSLQAKPVRQMMSIVQLAKADVENKLLNKVQRDDGSSYMDNFETPFNKQRFPQNMIDKNKDNDFEWSKSQDLPNLPTYKL